MCFTTSGLFPLGRMINLRRSAEIIGNVVPKDNHRDICVSCWRILLFFLLVGALFINSSEMEDPDEALTSQQLFTEIWCIFNMAVYAIYLLSVVFFSVLIEGCGCDAKLEFAICTDVVYYFLVASVQCTIPTMCQIFCYDVFGAHGFASLASVISRVFVLLVLLDFCLSIVQCNYVLGIAYVIAFNAVYCIAFDAAVRLDDDGSSVNYGSWITLCVLWSIALTHFKNWVNYKWWTSEKISFNVDTLQLLNVDAADDEAGDAESENLLTRASRATTVDDKSADDNDADRDAGGNGGAEDTDERSSGKRCINIAMGSCTDQRKRTIATYQALHRETPDMVLLLGDNAYTDLAPPTMTKLQTRLCKPVRVFADEYKLLLNHKDFRPEQYDFSDQVWLALWDDHDYGENDAAMDYAEKVPSKRAFIEFLQAIQETHRVQQIDEQIELMQSEESRGVYYFYDHEQKLDDAGVVKLRVFMMDTRFDRAEDESDIVGAQQWKWLRDACESAPQDTDWFLICNGSPLLNEGPETKPGHFKKQVGQETRNELFKILRANDAWYKKTILLSGDLHYSVWHSVDDQLYELTTSSFTHSKPWFCCKCWFKYLPIEAYSKYKEHSAGANNKSEPCKKNSFGLLKLTKDTFHFCVKDAFGYSYLKLAHKKQI